jgi:glycosyltransferase involved in cell wall biosynthesis
VIAVCNSLEEIARRYDPRKKVLRLEDISLLAEGAESAENIRESLKLEGPVVMYIGNLERYQGVDLLLESARMAAAEILGLELVIVGGSVADIDHYRSKAAKLGIGDRTHFLGPRPITQLNALLGQADLLVSPRISGGNTPMKIYSYLASGRPLLATRLDTHTQVLDDGVAELVAPEPAAMARGMIRLLQNREYAAALGRRGRERADAEYSYSRYESKLVRFYDAVRGSFRALPQESGTDSLKRVSK